jgi:hypothetical protein
MTETIFASYNRSNQGQTWTLWSLIGHKATMSDLIGRNIPQIDLEGTPELQNLFKFSKPDY